jgi:hypothetical protein
LQENIAFTSNTHAGYDGPVYDMPPPYDHTSRGHSLEKISNLRNFLVSFLKLLIDETSIQVLQILIEK